MSLELDLETAGVAAVTAAMASGATTSVALVEAYLDRIATLNPLVNAIRCLAPDALERAAALDAERAEGRVRGPLHGVPVLVKDNIDVAGLPTTAGAWRSSTRCRTATPRWWSGCARPARWCSARRT